MQEHRLKLGVPKEQLEARLYSHYVKLILDADPSAKLSQESLSHLLFGKDSPEGRALAGTAVNLSKALQKAALQRSDKAKQETKQSAQK